MSDETRVERHNRLASEIGQRVISECRDPIEQVILLESIVAGILGLMTNLIKTKEKKREVRLKLFDILSKGIKERLEKQS